MRTPVIVSIVLGVLLFVGLGVVFSYVSAYNFGNSTEATLKAAQTEAKNVLAQYGQRVSEAAQITEIYANDLNKVTTDAIEGRYGEGGSKAAVQWIQERNPQLDPAVYVKVQQIVEAGRKDFETAQRRQIDVLRQYETALGSFWRGFWLRQAGYPKIDLEDYNIVSTARANAIYDTKVEDAPIDLRP